MRRRPVVRESEEIGRPGIDLRDELRRGRERRAGTREMRVRDVVRKLPVWKNREVSAGPSRTPPTPPTPLPLVPPPGAPLAPLVPAAPLRCMRGVRASARVTRRTETCTRTEDARLAAEVARGRFCSPRRALHTPPSTRLQRPETRATGRNGHSDFTSMCRCTDRHRPPRARCTRPTYRPSPWSSPSPSTAVALCPERLTITPAQIGLAAVVRPPVPANSARETRQDDASGSRPSASRNVRRA
jgi:hypothetical protein